MTTDALILTGPTEHDPERDEGFPAVPEVAKPRSILTWFAVGWITLVILFALGASLLPFSNYAVPVGLPRSGPTLSWDGLFGLDSFGRSVTSRLAYGSRISLLIGVIAGVSAMVVGTALGLVAGYFRGKIETVIMYITDAFLAFPPLVLLLALSAVLEPSFTTLLFGLFTLITPTFVRLARANTMNWAAREFVLSAVNMGASRWRIAIREVLPNVAPPIIAFFPTIIAAIIVAEGSLSFLGLGIPPPTPSWGGMISAGRDYIREAPQLVLIPAAVIFFTVFSLNQLGDWARSRFDRTAQD